MGRPGAGTPWRDGDLVAVAASALVGLFAIAAGWFGASGSPTPARQVLWLNVAIAGLAIFAGGNGLWLMRLRRAIGERRVSLVSFGSAVEEELAPRRTFAARPADRPAFASAGWVRGADMARVHRPDCPLVAGKQVKPAQEDDGERCGVCANG